MTDALQAEMLRELLGPDSDVSEDMQIVVRSVLRGWANSRRRTLLMEIGEADRAYQDRRSRLYLELAALEESFGFERTKEPRKKNRVIANKSG